MNPRSDIHAFIGSRLGQVVEHGPTRTSVQDVIPVRVRTDWADCRSTDHQYHRSRRPALPPGHRDSPIAGRQVSGCSKRAPLLLKDSVHGDFHGTVEVLQDGSELIINGNRVHLIHAKNPEDIDYTEYGIKGCPGDRQYRVWRQRRPEPSFASRRQPGPLYRPGKDIPNVVYGVNHKSVDFEQERVLRRLLAPRTPLS